MSKLRDHVWIWGHPPGKLNEPCNLDSQMTPMEAALYLGARNVFYIPMGRKMNMTQCNKAMDPLNHVGWAIEKAYKRPEVIDRLRRTQPDTLTPIEAMQLIYELKQKLN